MYFSIKLSDFLLICRHPLHPEFNYYKWLEISIKTTFNLLTIIYFPWYSDYIHYSLSFPKMNNNTTDDPINVDHVSLYLLNTQWPVYIIWLFCTSLNFPSAAATIFGLVAYKVATRSLRLYLSLQMVLEMVNAVSVYATAWFHLLNFLHARPETMLVRRCFMWDQNLLGFCKLKTFFRINIFSLSLPTVVSNLSSMSLSVVISFSRLISIIQNCKTHHLTMNFKIHLCVSSWYYF